MLITWTQSTKVDCGHKIDQGRPAMFSSLPLLNTCSSRGIFCILELSRKIDKSHSFNIQTIMFRDCVCYIFASLKRALVKQGKTFLVNLESSF